jgi:DNA replication protein DnaC
MDIARGTGGQPRSIGQLTLEEIAKRAEVAGNPTLAELARRAEKLAASPEVIARHEASIREATEYESRERYALASAEAMRMIPLPKHHAAAVVEHYRPNRKGGPILRREEPLLVAAKWDRDRSRSVLALIGSMGVGKTTAAMSCALRALQAGESVLYVKEPTLVRWRKYVSMGEQIGKALGVGLLIIDELGTEKKHADEASAAILETVDDRLSVGRTMLIGNLDARAFGARYDARLADRMREVGIVAECAGQSLRGRAA